MLLELDILVRLRVGAETPASLAGTLRASEADVKLKIAALERNHLIRGAAAHYSSPATNANIPLLDPTGIAPYGPLLDRLSHRRPIEMLTFERFLAALFDEASVPIRAATVRLFEEVPRESTDENRAGEAFVLANATVKFAQRALEAEGKETVAKALERVPRHDIEELGYVGCLLTEDGYVEEMATVQRKEVVERASRACEAAWDLRPMDTGRGAGNASLSRQPNDPASHCVAAEETAFALRALAASCPGIDLIAEAKTAIG